MNNIGLWSKMKKCNSRPKSHTQNELKAEERSANAKCTHTSADCIDLDFGNAIEIGLIAYFSVCVCHFIFIV